MQEIKSTENKCRTWNAMLTSPIHCPTQGQWWSKCSTQLSQIEQCEQRGGLYSIQVSQYLTFTVIPLITTSFDRGKRGVWLVPNSRLFSWLSGSGGWAFRGIMPGSLPEVNRRSTSAWKKHRELPNVNYSYFIQYPKYTELREESTVVYFITTWRLYSGFHFGSRSTLFYLRKYILYLLQRMQFYFTQVIQTRWYVFMRNLLSGLNEYPLSLYIFFSLKTLR